MGYNRTMSEFLNPEPQSVLEEVENRHGQALTFLHAAVDLGFLHTRNSIRESARTCPGIPSRRRHFNDVNDNVWRYAKHICDPLIDDGLIKEFTEVEGGEVAVFPDGLNLRMKKGDLSGRTSNYPTRRIKSIRKGATSQLLFNTNHCLDLYINEGYPVDLVYTVGDSMDQYVQIGLRIGAVVESPFFIIDPSQDDVLHKISTQAFERFSVLRQNLAG